MEENKRHTIFRKLKCLYLVNIGISLCIAVLVKRLTKVFHSFSLSFFIMLILSMALNGSLALGGLDSQMKQCKNMWNS